jgi:uncharacterized protein (TIGR02594 family)
MALPEQYAWLEREGAPRMLVEALKLYGVTESKGRANTPAILEWAKEVGVGSEYTSDETAWCGLFCAVIAKRAGKEPPHDPLWALNWRNFGKAADKPMLGDVMIFTRDGGGHVAMYIGQDAKYWHILGGNQGDTVSIVRRAKSGKSWARRPDYTIQPANVRVVNLAATGRIASKEV